MSKNNTTLLKQFRSFYFQNTFSDIEKAIEYFCVFGGTSWNIDSEKPLYELIVTKVLKNYTYIHADMTKLTHSNKLSHALLSACAMGDRRVYSSYKRARLSREEGNEALHALLRSNIVVREYSIERPLSEEDDNSDKLDFATPFMRFWFAFVSPYYKSIKEGNYEEVEKAFSNREQSFCDLVFTKLSQSLLQKTWIDDPIIEIGGYWDKNCDIDILAKTKSGKLIAGACKYTQNKVKKTELSRLKEQCESAQLEPDTYVIFAKSGFSSELKSLKSETLKLFTVKSLKPLIEDVSEKDFIACEGKKY